MKQYFKRNSMKFIVSMSQDKIIFTITCTSYFCEYSSVACFSLTSRVHSLQPGRNSSPPHGDIGCIGFHSTAVIPPNFSSARMGHLSFPRCSPAPALTATAHGLICHIAPQTASVSLAQATPSSLASLT